MAQDIEIANAQYNDVPSIEVPLQGGGTASFVDTTDADAIASEIDTGKTAYVNGVKLTGTRSGGGYTETVLYENSSGISSGTIPLLDDWNNYHFISFVVWNGGTGAKNQQFFSSSFLEDCYSNNKDFIVIRFTTSQVTLTPKTDYKTLSIKNNGDSGKIYKIVGHKFG